MSDDRNTIRYAREVFDVSSMDEAKRIILTPEDTSTDERWQRETPYLADCIGEFLAPNETSIILDYGCGIGRMSKALIARHGCTVIGADISHSMRHLAPAYVGDTRFMTCAPAAIDALIEHGLAVDSAIAVWTLQHSPWVNEDIERIRRILKPDGALFVCNAYRSAIPTDKGWADIGFDIRALLDASFERLSIDPVSRDHTSDLIADSSFLGRYRKAAA